DRRQPLPCLLVDDARADGAQLRVGVPQRLPAGGFQIRIELFAACAALRFLTVPESSEIDRELSHSSDEVSRLRCGGIVVGPGTAVDHSGDLADVEGGDGDEDSDPLTEDLFGVVVGDVGVDFVVSSQLWSAFGHGTTAEPPTGADDERREQIATGAGDGLDSDRALLDHASEDDVTRAAAVE